MERTVKVINDIRVYLAEHPKEKKEVADALYEIADKLELGEMHLIDTSKYIKNIKDTHNIAVFEIFSKIYRAAKNTQ
jgi:hypothetical protein